MGGNNPRSGPDDRPADGSDASAFAVGIGSAKGTKPIRSSWRLGTPIERVTCGSGSIHVFRNDAAPEDSSQAYGVVVHGLDGEWSLAGLALIRTACEEVTIAIRCDRLRRARDGKGPR